MDEFKIQYDAMEAIAKAFGAQAEEVTSIIQAIKSPFETLQGGDFKGKSAREFFNEMNSTIFPAYQRLVQALQQAAETTAQISKNINDQENEASGLFN